MESAYMDGASPFTAFFRLVRPLLIFFTMQRYFVRGILAGSVKG
jgi:ABC-type glycerol-3-phosphate transport system permease component